MGRKKRKEEEKRITQMIHRLMDYSFGEVDKYQYLTKREKNFIKTSSDLFLLKSKRFKIKLK